MSKQPKQHPWNNPIQNNNSNMAQSTLNLKPDPNKFLLFGETGVDQTQHSNVLVKNKLQNFKNVSNNNNNKKANHNMQYNNNPHFNKMSNATYVKNKVNTFENGNNVIITEIENHLKFN